MRRRPFAVALAALMAASIATPVIAADRDKDGLRDGWERKYGVTSPNRRDSDGDGVIDSAEDNDGDRLGNLGEQRFGTHPGKKDTDGDGRSDAREDHDRDGRTNGREQDQRRLPSRLKPTLTRTRTDVPVDRGKCLTKAGQTQLKKCWFGRQGASRRVVLMGDSHALMWLGGMAKAADQAGVRLITLFKGGCPPLLGVMNSGQYELDRGKSCRAWRRNAYAWLEQNPVDLLIIAHADSYGVVDTSGNVLSGQRKIRTWRSGVKKTLNEVFDPARTMLFGDIPRNVGNPIPCLKRHPGNMSRCVSPRESTSERKVEMAIRSAVADKGAQFRTLFPNVCTYAPCPVVQGNILMWRDRHHVTDTFATKLAPSIREVMNTGLATAASAGTTEFASAVDATEVAGIPGLGELAAFVPLADIAADG